MGTSTNVSSPNIPTWRLSKATLGRNNLPIERQSQEIWRAALTDRGGRLKEELCDPLFVEACLIADSGIDPGRAMRQFDNVLEDKHAASLLFDIGKRALVRASAAKAGASGFAAELFAETVSYYVSRDIPSLIGMHGRIETTTASIELKELIRDIARQAAQVSGPIKTDVASWKNYVSNVLIALQGSRRQK